MTEANEFIPRAFKRSGPVLLGCLVTVALLAPAGAAGLQLAGKFAFRMDGDMETATCARLTQAMATRLAKAPYRCESTQITSGEPALLCSRPDGRGYLVFNTKAACESEREDEANAE